MKHKRFTLCESEYFKSVCEPVGMRVREEIEKKKNYNAKTSKSKAK